MSSISNAMEREFRRIGGVTFVCDDGVEFYSEWLPVGDIEQVMRDGGVDFGEALEFLQYDRCPICNPGGRSAAASRKEVAN